MHLMPSASPTPALLTASLRYGVVARSYPLTGKILRGYLDASGTLNGIGNGNPNAEFSPDVTRCVMSADGGTARILWGFRTGAVAVTTAHKAMEAARAIGARWLRCPMSDSHEGAVEDAAWASDGVNAPNFFVTGANDGRVKIWDAKKVTCIWTSRPKIGQIVKDPCVKVAVDVVSGTVAAALRSGELVAWTGFSPFFAETSISIGECNIQEVRIPAPKSSLASGPYSDASDLSVTSFYLYSESPSKVSVLTTYKGEPRLYRNTINLLEGTVGQTCYGDEFTGAITSLCPVFASRPGEHSFVLAGDQFGSVSVFPWNSAAVLPQSSANNGVLPVTQCSVPSTHRIQAHDDGAITALVWTPTALVTGSSKGSLRAFDSLTLISLRRFSYPSPRTSVEEEVKDIVVDQDFFAASIGNRIVAWRGEPQGKTEKTWKGKRSTRVANVIAKYHREHLLSFPSLDRSNIAFQEQVEISREIRESRQELDHEHAYTQRAFGREREQNSTLEHLGLSEVEAVEYVLMLSRDEEEGRQLAELQNEFEVFGGEFDEDVRTPIVSPSSFIASSTSWNPEQRRTSGVCYTPSSSIEKIQISPRHRPEPMEAGFSTSPISRSTSGSLSSSMSSPSSLSRMSSQAPPDDPAHFPSISSTPTRRSVSGSPESFRSAWSTPLRSSRSSEGPSSPSSRAGGSIAGSPTVPRSPGVSLLSQKFAAALAVANEEEELKFALELSLAEARSRGEDV
jgi:hypothetical protein